MKLHTDKEILNEGYIQYIEEKSCPGHYELRKMNYICTFVL